MINDEPADRLMSGGASPYLLQPLRSWDEVRQSREAIAAPDDGHKKAPAFTRAFGN